jgi:hypothetical protein
MTTLSPKRARRGSNRANEVDAAEGRKPDEKELHMRHLILLAAISLGASLARAQEATPAPAPEAAPAASPAPASATSSATSSAASSTTGEAAPLALRLPWTKLSGQGVGLSYENGAFGQTWEQGLKLQIPFATCGKGRRNESCAAINIRPQSLMQFQVGAGSQNSFDLGGRVEIIGRTPMLLNLIRIYGGGGAGAFYEVTGQTKGHAYAAGGGQFGVELFLQPEFSFYSEIGGDGCGSSTVICSGATVVAGMTWYL